MSLVLRRLPVCALFFCALIAGKGAMAQMTPSLSYSWVSTDGREIAFVSDGDIWTVAASLMFALVSWDSLRKYRFQRKLLRGWLVFLETGDFSGPILKRPQQLATNFGG